MNEEHSAHRTHDEGAEKPVETSYALATKEGAERLHRSWPALLTTGFLGGVEISVGILAYLLTVHETGSSILGGVAFSIGFIALFLAIVLQTPVTWLEERARMRRGNAAMIVVLGVMGSLGILAYLLISPFVGALRNLVEDLPTIVERIHSRSPDQ